MFSKTDLFNQPLQSWNTSKVVDMSYMFFKAKAFNQPIGKWDINEVDDMTRMFAETTSFNQPFTEWDISNVTSTANMFHNAEAFQQSIDHLNIYGNICFKKDMFGVEEVTVRQKVELPNIWNNNVWFTPRVVLVKQV